MLSADDSESGVTASVVFEAELQNFNIVTIVSGEFRQNGYIVIDAVTNHCLLIDPGSFEAFYDYVSSRSLVVDQLLLTHGHFDHVGGVRDLMSAFDVTCMAHSSERRLLRQASLYSIRFIGRVVQAPESILFFDDSLTSIPWGQYSIRVFHAPGHTAGSVCYALPGMVFTGDTLFKNHIGPTIYPGSSKALLLDSVRRVLSELDADTRIFAGHGSIWSVGEARSWLTTSGDAPNVFNIFGG